MANNSFNCGLEAALAVIGGKWKPLVLFNLAQNVHRYGELRRAVGGVTDKVLIQQLKELERDEIIERVDFHEIPPKVEYSLTPFGQSWPQRWVRCASGARNICKRWSALLNDARLPSPNPDPLPLIPNSTKWIFS